MLLIIQINEILEELLNLWKKLMLTSGMIKYIFVTGCYIKVAGYFMKVVLESKNSANKIAFVFRNPP